MTDLLTDVRGLPPLCLPSMLGSVRKEFSADPLTVMRLVASDICNSKASLASRTTSARSAVSGVVDQLVRRQALEVSGWVATDSGRGRPAERLVVPAGLGLVGLIDAGATGVGVTLATLSQKIVACRYTRWDVQEGPRATLEHYLHQLRDLQDEVGDAHGPLRHVVIGLPARVDVETQRPVRPTIMPGWDGYPVCEEVITELGVPATLENDTNLRAVGEACAGKQDWLPLLAIKVGTGIGGGLVDTYGHVFHGFRGAAGEIGHIPVEGADDHPCTCGAVGCVEANASVLAMIRRLGDRPGSSYLGNVDDIDVLLRDLRAHDPETIKVVREAGDKVGDLVAVLLNVLNPRRVSITCPIGSVSDEFLASVRSRAYERARPLATREVMIAYGVLGEASGTAGAMAMGIDKALEDVVQRR